MFGKRDLIPKGRGGNVAPNRFGWEHPLMAFPRDFERLFEGLWRGFDVPAFERRGLVSPDIDVSETDEAILVTAELPGMEEKDVEVLWSDNVLTIKGEKKEEHKEKVEGRTYSERSYGSFERRIPIASEVVADKFDATFSNGVLTIELPKTPESRKHFKRIPVRGEVEAKKSDKKAA
jgi:HSP20 family protein